MLIGSVVTLVTAVMLAAEFVPSRWAAALVAIPIGLKQLTGSMRWKVRSDWHFLYTRRLRKIMRSLMDGSKTEVECNAELGVVEDEMAESFPNFEE